MYDNEAKAYVNSAQMGMVARNPEVTIGENLDIQITLAEKRLADLKATKDRLASTGLLSSRIEDLRQAMNY
jgi:hypothetical protein